MVDTSAHAYLVKEGKSYGLIGASLLDNLDGFIPKNIGHESVVCYVPKRDIKIRFGKNPFNSRIIKLAGRVNFNREVNAESFILPIDLSREMLGYKQHISAVYIDAEDGESNEALKIKVQELVGASFTVKTNFEKNELIYKTSKSEKIIVLIILIFIFILAAFNLVASLTMLFVEKLENIGTMISFGSSRKFIFKIFFYEGLLISGKGILFGLIAGYAVCLLQMNLGLIIMPNSGGESFPMNISVSDGFMIFSLVTLLSVLFSYVPVKYLIQNNLKK